MAVHDNRRIKKHIDSESPGSPDGIDRYEHLFYAGVQLVETRNTTGVSDQPESLQPKYEWVWSPRYVDAPILRDENTDQDSLCDDARIYYLADANMNVTSLVDTAGDAVERYVYDPYGRVTMYNADWSSTRSSSSYSNYVLYTGRHLDAETALYYYRARYYSAELGRFLVRDPIGYQADLNFYRYVKGQPAIATDATGLVQWDKAQNTGVQLDWGGVAVTIYLVKTDRGTDIPVGKANDGKSFNCHSYTFGGGLLSPEGLGAFGILNDEWVPECCGQAQGGVVAFFNKKGEVTHSGIIKTVALIGAHFDEKASTLDSKWGFRGPIKKGVSFLENAQQYGPYRCYVKKRIIGCCPARGGSELPLPQGK